MFLFVVIETSPAYDIDNPALVTAEAGLDYGHVSLRYGNNPGDEEGLIVPIIRDDNVEGLEVFQVNVYDLIDPFQVVVALARRRKREGMHPLDTGSQLYPCATILIVDDDGKFFFFFLFIMFIFLSLSPSPVFSSVRFHFTRFFALFFILFCF